MDAIKFNCVKAKGSAGGKSRAAWVTVEIDGWADTVEDVRALVEAAPSLLAALKAALPVLMSATEQWSNGEDCYSEAFSMAEAAIAQATA